MKMRMRVVVTVLAVCGDIIGSGLSARIQIDSHGGGEGDACAGVRQQRRRRC